MGARRKRLLGACALAIVLLPFQIEDSRGQAVVSPPPVPVLPLPTDKVNIQVYESTFNKLAAAALPFTFKGNYTFTFLGADICSSAYEVTVSQVQFAITPNGIHLTGSGTGTWCHVGTGIDFDTTVNAALETTITMPHMGAAPSLHAAAAAIPPSNLVAFSTQTFIQITIASTNVQPVFQIAGHTVPLPIHIDIATLLNLPSIPLTPAPVTLSSAEGSIQLHLVPSQLALILNNHYLELQGTVQLH